MDLRERCDKLWNDIGLDHGLHFANRALLEAFAREIRNDALDDAMKAIHCECNRYCDYDEAEEKIRALKDNAEQVKES